MKRSVTIVGDFFSNIVNNMYVISLYPFKYPQVTFTREYTSVLFADDCYYADIIVIHKTFSLNGFFKFVILKCFFGNTNAVIFPIFRVKYPEILSQGFIET